MASPSPPRAPGAPNAPLGWLSNIIGGGSSKNESGGSEVENCTDVDELAGGIALFLGRLLSNDGSDGAPAAAARADGEIPPGVGGEGKGEKSEAPAVTTPQTDKSKEVASETTSPSEDLAARLSRLKSLLYDERTARTSSTSKPKPIFQGSSSSDPNPPPVASAVVQSLAVNRPEVIPNLLANLPLLPFEARKDTSSVLNYLLVCGLPAEDVMSVDGGGRGPEDDDKSWRLFAPVTNDFVHYVDENFANVMGPIVRLHNCQGCDSAPALETDEQQSNGTNEARQTAVKSTPDVALHCGSLLRSALRHPRLFGQFVSPEHAPRFVYPFLDSFVHQPNFEVAGDALETVRVVLTGGSGAAAAMGAPAQGVEQQAEENTALLASAFLERDYAAIIEERFNTKMLSEKASYVTKRASVQLLSTILLTRSNYAVMMRYIASRSNLRTVMLLLRDPSPHITLDAFHVFKVFVANPSKPPEVVKVLVDNKIKLVRYLAGLHRDREDVDEQFRDEKRLVIATLEGLELE